MPLDPKNVPAVLQKLLPVAESWGIGDDFDREAAVNAASRDDLELLIHSIDDVSDDDLFGWLAGQQSFDSRPSAEYDALTCFTMAIDSAKIRLARSKDS